jgi:hypothetical protein
MPDWVRKVTDESGRYEWNPQYTPEKDANATKETDDLLYAIVSLVAAFKAETYATFFTFVALLNSFTSHTHFVLLRFHCVVF